MYTKLMQGILNLIFFIIKGTVIVNLSDTSCKDSDIRFTKVPLKP